MAPIDGAIGMKININLPQTTDVNISKAQPSKASGLGGVVFLRSKSAPTLYEYRFRIIQIEVVFPLFCEDTSECCANTISLMAF